MNIILNLFKRSIGHLHKNFWIFFVIIFIPIWYFFGANLFLTVSKNFSYKADISSVDNFYDNKTGEYKGEQYSKTVFLFNVLSKKDDVLLLKGLFDVESLDGRMIFKSEPLYGINNLTGEHVVGEGDKNRVGYLFAPKWLNKDKTFKFWHITDNVPSEMEYVSEEKLYGLRVFKYKKKNNGLTDQTSIMGFLPGVPSKFGVKLASDLFLWVEPITGYLVKMEDYSTDYFYYDIKTGEKLYPYNQFFNTYTEETIIKNVNDATKYRNRMLMIQFGVPLLILLFTLLFILTIHDRFSRLINFFKNNRLVIIVYVVGFGLSIYSYYSFSQHISLTEKNNFSNRSVEIDNLIRKRIDIYTNILFSARGLFNASKDVSMAEWKMYADSLNLDKKYPGIQGIGFSKIISPKDKESFVLSMRKTGFPNFNITPSGNRNLYTSIIYLEPFNNKNKKAFGYDMFSEINRRKAMVRAMDTGDAAISSQITLVQNLDDEPKKNGFLAYVPVYKGGVIPKDVSKREENILGYVYAAFNMDDLMRGILDFKTSDLTFRIYDGLKELPDNIIFDFSKNDRNLENTGNLLFRQNDVLYLNGHPWTIEYYNSSSYTRDFNDIFLSYLILFGGILLTIMLGVSIYTIERSKKKAVEYADKMNKDLLVALDDIEKKNSDMETLANDLQKFKLAVDNASDQVVITDSEGMVIYGNSVIEKITGYTAQEAIGKKAGTLWKSPMPKEYYERMWNTIKIQKKSFVGEIVNKRKNGEIYNALVSISPVLNNKGDVIYFVAIERDITKEKEVDKAKSEFVSIASHQLRTPLSAISWYVEMLLAGDAGALNKEQLNYLSEVHVASQRMVSLVNSLLNVSRLDLGTFIIEPEPVDLLEMSKSVISEMTPQIIEKKVKIEDTYNLDTNIFKADSKLLRIVFQNLISNALKYSNPESVIGLNICYVARNKSIGGKILDTKSLVISVSNSGIGIPSNQKDKIFTKLFRADNARDSETEGTGLGLYIVKSIIDQSGGNSWFTSEEGGTTVFYVSIPAVGMKKKAGTRKLS